MARKVNKLPDMETKEQESTALGNLIDQER